MSGNLKIFVDKRGKSIKFFLISGPTYVTKEGGLEPRRVKQLSEQIEQYGGNIRKDINDAAVWIVNDGVLDTYKEYCAHDPEHRAEGPGFIKKCIDRKSFQDEYLEEKRPMAGRHPGKRSHFIPEEIEVFCQWVASKIPDASSGGRFGVILYKMFVEEGQKFPMGRWGLANNHPMQAWKEHYKKNRLRLNPRIDEIVAEKGYTAESKTAYRSDRRLNKRVRVQVEEEEEEEEDADEEESPISEDEAPPPKRRRIFRRQEEEEVQDEEEAAAGFDAAGPSGGEHSPAPEADEGFVTPPNTQRTLVNPTPSRSRTYSHRASSRRQRAIRNESIEVESEDEDPSGARTAVATSSTSGQPAPRTIERVDTRSPFAQAGYVGSPRHRSRGRSQGQSQPTFESVREVEHGLGEDGEERDRTQSFVTETDDARARDDLYVPDSPSVDESEDPFEVTDTDA